MGAYGTWVKPSENLVLLQIFYTQCCLTSGIIMAWSVYIKYIIYYMYVYRARAHSLWSYWPQRLLLGFLYLSYPEGNKDDYAKSSLSQNS